MTDATKFVLVEQRNSFRGTSYAAVRGLAFETREAAEAHIAANKRYRHAHVESRIVKADDTNERKTCQCCFRPILSKHGVIAHHGYERPEHGWQTASCSGAKHAPFELSRDVLGLLIQNLRARHERDYAARCDVANGEKPVTHIYTLYGSNLPKGRKEVTIHFTAATFEAEKAEHPRGFDRYSRDGFEQYREKDLARRDRSLKALAEHLVELQARYDAWKQTHEYRDGLWITL